jgi:glycosyltransferase involved in cell wall biosynthesis
MRVLLDMTFARWGPSGTGVYLSRLAPALRAEGVDVVEAINERRGAPGGGAARSLRNFAEDRWWTRVELPRLARRAGVDVLHHPLPAYAPAAPCPQVVTVHDLAFERLPWAFDRRYRAWAHRAHRDAARHAAAVVCPSQSTKRDVRSRWGLPDERVVVAPHGPGQELAVAPDRSPEPRHFLYVGDDEPRKNLVALRVAAATAPLPLVIAGSAGDRHADLAALHAGAAALVHPSLHEGFGLTVLEAMAAGTPVVAGRVPGVAELCADAALLVDVRDPAALGAAMDRVARDAGLRERLAESGLRRAAAFSWARSARAHVEAYETALRARPGEPIRSESGADTLGAGR